MPKTQEQLAVQLEVLKQVEVIIDQEIYLRRMTLVKASDLLKLLKERIQTEVK
ncbi:hypothetical protein H0W91_02635 [Patescibacteria group bacterium]|nr:hypothetical protein [Patescibacteria group bacterium]